MPSIVYQTPQGKRLIGGLDWGLLPASGSIDSQLRERASDRGASYASSATAATPEEFRVKGKTKQIKRVSAGYYSAADGSKPPKGAHSLAAAFAQWSGDHEASLLSVKTADGLYAVVVVINGLPVLDRLEKESRDAWQKALPYIQERPTLSVFSDDLVMYPSSVLSEGLLEQILAATSKATAIKAVPPDAAKLALIAFVVLGIAGGFIYHSKWQAEKTRKEAIARQRAADPIPKYLTALAASRQAVGVERASLEAAADAVQRLPLAPEGWRITRIGCLANAGCEVVLFRSTGTYASLKAAMPYMELSPTSDINLNEARMTWKQELTPGRLDPANPLPSLGNFLQGGDASKLQTWLVSGVTIQLTPPLLWPQTAGVPQAFKHPQALAAGKFEVSAVELPQLREFLATAPSNVNWTGWSIEVGDAKQEPLSRAKARLIGNYYVTNH